MGEVAYLSADVVALTGVTSSYLSFLVRLGVIQPRKHLNGRTNLFSPEDIERVRWAMQHRGEMSVEEMRQRLTPVGAR